MATRVLTAKAFMANATKNLGSTLHSQIQAARTTGENFRSLLRSFARAVLAVGETQIDPEFLAISMNNNRKMANRLEVVPSSPELEKIWQDEYAKGTAFMKANPDHKGILPAGQGTTDPYFVFLATGQEARANGWELTNLMKKGASLEEVFFIHQDSVEEYQKAVWAYETALAIQKSL